MNWKKAITASMATVLLASIGASVAPSLNSNNTAHAEGVLQVYEKTEPQDARWHSVRGVYQNQANFGFNKRIGGTITANFKNGAPVNVRRKGHIITVVPMLDDPGKIIRVDGRRTYSRHQVLSLLNKRVYRYHYRKHHARHHAVKRHRKRTHKVRRHYARKHRRRSYRRY